MLSSVQITDFPHSPLWQSPAHATSGPAAWKDRNLLNAEDHSLHDDDDDDDFDLL